MGGEDKSKSSSTLIPWMEGVDTSGQAASCSDSSLFGSPVKGWSSTKCGTCHLKCPEVVPFSKWPGPPVFNSAQGDGCGMMRWQEAGPESES